MARFGKTLTLTMLVGLALTSLVGCPPSTGNNLQVINNAATDMAELNIKPIDCDESTVLNWGSNQLCEPPLTSEPGASGVDNQYTLNTIPDGIYDLRAIFNTPAGASLESRLAVYRFNVPFGNASWKWIFTSEVPGETQTWRIVEALRPY